MAIWLLSLEGGDNTEVKQKLTIGMESEAPRASTWGIFTTLAKPAEAYPPTFPGAEASADTLFAFIPVLQDRAFCEGG